LAGYFTMDYLDATTTFSTRQLADWNPRFRLRATAPATRERRRYAARRVWRCAATVLLLMALSCPSLVAADEGAQVALSADPQPVAVGSASTVTVTVDQVQSLYGLDIRLSFDPEKAQILDADSGKDGEQVIPGDLLSLDFMVRNTVDNVEGTVWYAVTQVNPSQPVSGDGMAFSFDVQAISNGDCPIDVTYVKFADREGNALPASFSGLTLSISDDDAPKATPRANSDPIATDIAEPTSTLTATPTNLPPAAEAEPTNTALPPTATPQVAEATSTPTEPATTESAPPQTNTPQPAPSPTPDHQPTATAVPAQPTATTAPSATPTTQPKATKVAAEPETQTKATPVREASTENAGTSPGSLTIWLLVLGPALLVLVLVVALVASRRGQPGS